MAQKAKVEAETAAKDEKLTLGHLKPEASPTAESAKQNREGSIQKVSDEHG